MPTDKKEHNILPIFIEHIVLALSWKITIESVVHTETKSMPEITLERVNAAIRSILETLGEPECPLHREALSAFEAGNYQSVKRLAATNLDDYYCKSLGYLGGALKLTPNTDTILAESARAAADFVRKKTLAQLGTRIAESLGES